MRLSRLFLYFLSVTTITTSIANAQYADSTSLARTFYENARRSNSQALERMLRNGYPIDATDQNGNTALCIAMLQRNSSAFNTLKKYGANTNHSCVKNIEAQPSSKLGKGFTWQPAYTVGAITVAGGAGIAAALAGGGGGGGSGGKKQGNRDNSGGNNGGTDPYPTDMSAADFETNEYKKGNFLSLINASSAYSRLYVKTSANEIGAKNQLNKVNVGIIDTGVDSSNPDFSNTSITGFNVDYGPCRGTNSRNCWTTPNARGISYLHTDEFNMDIAISTADYNKWAIEYDSDYSWDSNPFLFAPNSGADNMHGTHVAGIIAADKNDNNMHGIAFSNTNLIAARWDFMTYPGYVISKMVDNNAQIINMSFGYNASDEINATTLTDNYYRIARDEIDNYIMTGVLKAATNNTIMVMSAGNEGYSQPGLHNAIPLLSAHKDALQNLFITVVAVGSDGKITSYSNRCGITKNHCIAAPGGSSNSPIWSTGTYGNEMVGMSGTSMAAPVVSGSIALLMGAYPYLTPQQVVELVFESANKKGDYANTDIYGQGLLDLEAATNPQGYLATIEGNTVENHALNITMSRIVVPATFQTALVKNMPKNMTAFDKYKRPFTISTASMVQSTHSGYRNFKNDLYNFSRHRIINRSDSDEFSFGFAPSSFSNTDTGMGFMNISYRSENRETSFFFTENSRFGGKDYNDSTLFNPYLAMNNAYGMNNMLNYDRLGFGFSFMTGENGLYDGDTDYHDHDFDNRSYAFNIESKYAITPQINISAISGMLAEDDAILGMNGRGAFGVGDSNTYYAGLAINWTPSAKWSFGGTYYHGWTEPTSTNSSIISTSRMLSDSFALDGHYNLNKTDVIGLQISSPLRVYNGHADFNIATGRDKYSDKIYRENIRSSLKPSAREYKFALYHNRELAERITFRSETAIRINPEHNRDNDTDYRIMLGLGFAF